MKHLYKPFWLVVIALCVSQLLTAQSVIISDNPAATPDNSAILDLQVTGASKKGFLVPRMTQAQRLAITSPAPGLLVYQTDDPQGLYYFTGVNWGRVALNFTSPAFGSLIPISGPANSSVTINGSNFSSDAQDNSVTVNGATATILGGGPSQVIFRVPAGATTGPVVLSTGGATVNAGTYTVLLPSASGFSPSSAAFRASVTINGSNFSPTIGDNSVTVNGTTATISSATATQIVFTVPVGAPATSAVVLNASGTVLNVGNYTVLQPAVTGITATAVPFRGSATITGTNLGPAVGNNSVTVNGVTASITSASATQVVFTVPVGVPTTSPVVLTSDGVTTSTQSLNVAHPAISGVTPNPASFRQIITITGTNFGPGGANSILLNGSTNVTVTTVSSTELRFTLPITMPATTTIDVTSDGIALTQQSIAVNQPAITAVAPNPASFRQIITITGTNFGPSTSNSTISLNGGTAFNPATASATQLTFTLPAGSPTPTTINVTIDAVAIAQQSLTVNQPSVSGFTPATASFRQSITINGSNFTGVIANNPVTIGGITATTTSFSTTQIVVTVPPTAPASSAISLNADGVVISVGTLTVNQPSVSSVNPTSNVNFRQSIAINGSNFTGTTANNLVTVGGLTATVTGVSSTQIVFTVPSGAPASSAVDLVADGVSLAAVATLSVLQPSISNMNPTSTDVAQQVTLTGTNITGAVANNTVTVNGVAATTISVSTTQIVFRVNAGSTTGAVSVNADGVTLAPGTLTIGFSGTTTTVAGTGTPGSLDGAAASAQFNTPRGMAFDEANNLLYIADANNHRIRVLNLTTNFVSTLAGGTSGFADGTGIGAQFNFPIDVALDASGTNLYVADLNNHRIREIVISTGVVTTIAGTGSTTPFTNGDGNTATFNRPASLIVVGSMLYVSDFSNFRVRAIDLGSVNKTVITLAGSGTENLTNGTGTGASFRHMTDIVANAAGTSLYVYEGDNSFEGGAVREIVVSTAVVSTLAGSTSSASCNTFDDNTGTLARFETDGIFLPNSSPFPAMAIAQTSGNLLVNEVLASGQCGRTREVTDAGVTTTKYFNGAVINGVAVNAAGTTIYQCINNTIRRITQ